MDLRPFYRDSSQPDEAASRLHYQPFIIDDDRVTGVAYSWLYTEEPADQRHSDFLFDRRIVSVTTWDRAFDANRRLATMYDAFVDALHPFCRGGSFLDIGCNTGYLPVRASLCGVPITAGIDCGDYSDAFCLLNTLTGASAQFEKSQYEASCHAFVPAIDKRYDAVSCTALLCHMPDPLHFLKAIAELARHALLIWSGFIDTEDLLIRYSPQNRFQFAPFPNSFDDGTSISTGMLFHAMHNLGFDHCRELEQSPKWLPANWHMSHLSRYQQFRPFLFHR
jgi:SAM-dependent methyltransferase